MSDNLTMTDLFCGAGGSSSGAVLVRGVRVRQAANHWALAVETHNTNHPNTDHDVADISQVDPRRYPRTDLLWASPECFPAGTLITTTRGQVPIEEIQVGDLALTHEGRWRAVTWTKETVADTVVVAGGGHYGLETTASHPFYAKQRFETWDNPIRRYRTSYGDPDWVDAGDLSKSYYLAAPITAEVLPIPSVPGRGIEFTEDFWWVVGRWLGDGSIRYERPEYERRPAAPRSGHQPAGSSCVRCGKPAKPLIQPAGRCSPYCGRSCKTQAARKSPRTRGELTIVCGKHEFEDLALVLKKACPELRWRSHETRTAYAFDTAHIGLCEWLVENFGKYAYGKTLPSWVLTMPENWRRALLEGYVSADGCVARQTQTASVSKRLMIAIRLLALSLGELASLRAPTKRTSGVIEGRIVNMRPLYSVAWTTDPSLLHARTHSDYLHRWFQVRSVKPGRPGVTVYNFEVEEDNSYVADGVVVHNCVNHSIAQGGNKKAQSDDQMALFGETLPDEAAERSRATMWDVPRFAEHHDYAAIIVENVVDVIKWKMWPAWVMATDCLGYDHELVFMNSMHAQAMGDPAPQSRDRVYVVLWKRGNPRPDIEKWTRPKAHCSSCDEDVRAIQWWKNGKAWGRYRSQYRWRCPKTSCGNAMVEPKFLAAATAIDWDLPGEVIGRRARVLSPKTLQRIAVGLQKFGRPVSLAALEETADLALWDPNFPVEGLHSTPGPGLPYGLSMLVPVEGREGKNASLVTDPMRTQTARNETGLFVPPFIAELRGGGSDARAVTEPLATVTASGNHHGLVVPPSASHEIPTIDECEFRMLEPYEIQAGMAFDREYIVLGNKRERVRQLGNAVTPPASRDLVAAVAESLTGESMSLA